MNVRYGFPIVAAALLTACSGGSHSASVLPESPGATPFPSSSAASSAFTYDKTALKGATLVGTAKVSSISVDLIPLMQNAGGLVQYAKSVNDPRSGMYRQFLTPQEIGARYGASQTSYAAAVKYFQSQGLSVATWPQRMLLHVTGSQANMEAALHTTFAWYRNGTSTFLAPNTTPSPPNSAGVVGAANIVMHSQLFTNHVVVSAGRSNGLTYGYSPQQIAAAFDYTGAYAAGYTGAGITTGVIGTAGMNPDDVPAYKSLYGIGGSGTVTLVSASDANAPGNSALGFATPPPVTKPCFGVSPISPSATCNPEDGETQLDTEQIASLAPDANLRYYLAYNPNDACGAIDTTCPPGAGIPLQGLGEIDAELQTAIADNHADVLSLSFGGPEAALAGNAFNASGVGITPLEMAALASEGIAIFVSSGDAGAETCLQWGGAPDPNSPCVSYPATDPNAVGVGGVNTPLNSAGQFIGALTVWGNHTSGGFGGTGGGVSAYFPLTAYQQGAAGITGSTRNVPDVSLEADNETGVSVLMYGGALSPQRITPIGGTSVAAPEAAAMWALVLQACKQSAGCATATGPVPYRLGNPNAYFYKAYANATTYASTFYDVLYGNNGMACFPTATPCPSPTDTGYSASKGYDLATGVGVPFARALIKTVVGK